MIGVLGCDARVTGDWPGPYRFSLDVIVGGARHEYFYITLSDMWQDIMECRVAGHADIACWRWKWGRRRLDGGKGPTGWVVCMTTSSRITMKSTTKWDREYMERQFAKIGAKDNA